MDIPVKVKSTQSRIDHHEIHTRLYGTQEKYVRPVSTLSKALNDTAVDFAVGSRIFGL